MTANYEAGIRMNVLEGFTVDLSKVDTSKAGTYTATVTYEGKTAAVTITVYPTSPAAAKVTLEETPNVEVDQNGEREHPEPVDPDKPTEPDTPEPETPAKKKGCGGSLIAGSAMISITAALGATLLFLKKRKEK